MMMSANVQPGIWPSVATAPLAFPTVRASHSSRSIESPVKYQSGAPSPAASSSKAPASSGMMTKVVNGMAMRLAPIP